MPCPSPRSATAIGRPARTAIGLRTAWPRLSVHVSEPKAHWSSGAVVRVIVTLNDRDCSGGTVSLLALTLAVKPGGASTVGLYCDAWSGEVLVTVRVTVWLPGQVARPRSSGS